MRFVKHFLNESDLDPRSGILSTHVDKTRILISVLEILEMIRQGVDMDNYKHRLFSINYNVEDDYFTKKRDIVDPVIPLTEKMIQQESWFNAAGIELGSERGLDDKRWFFENLNKTLVFYGQKSSEKETFLNQSIFFLIENVKLRETLDFDSYIAFGTLFCSDMTESILFSWKMYYINNSNKKINYSEMEKLKTIFQKRKTILFLRGFFLFIFLKSIENTVFFLLDYFLVSFFILYVIFILGFPIDMIKMLIKNKNFHKKKCAYVTYGAMLSCTDTYNSNNEVYVVADETTIPLHLDLVTKPQKHHKIISKRSIFLTNQFKERNLEWSYNFFGYTMLLSDIGNFNVTDGSLNNDYTNSIKILDHSFWIQDWGFELKNCEKNIVLTGVALCIEDFFKFSVDQNCNFQDGRRVSKNMSNKIQSCFAAVARKYGYNNGIKISRNYLPTIEKFKEFFENNYANLIDKDLEGTHSISIPLPTVQEIYENPVYEISTEVIEEEIVENIREYEMIKELIPDDEEEKSEPNHDWQAIEQLLVDKFGSIHSRVDRKHWKKIKYLTYCGLFTGYAQRQILFDPEFVSEVKAEKERLVSGRRNTIPRYIEKRVMNIRQVKKIKKTSREVKNLVKEGGTKKILKHEKFFGCTKEKFKINFSQLNQNLEELEVQRKLNLLQQLHIKCQYKLRFGSRRRHKTKPRFKKILKDNSLGLKEKLVRIEKCLPYKEYNKWNTKILSAEECEKLNSNQRKFVFFNKLSRLYYEFGKVDKPIHLLILKSLIHKRLSRSKLKIPAHMLTHSFYRVVS